MQADAVELHVLAVDQAALVGVETHVADPQRRFVLVQDAVLLFDRDLQAVQVGRIDGPEVGLVQFEPDEVILPAARSDLDLRPFDVEDDFTVLIEEFRDDGATDASGPFILDGCRDLARGTVLIDL